MRTVRFFKGVCDTMKQDLHLPADYAVLSDNEMTYTQGGGVISTLLGLYSAGATIVGTGVLAASSPGASSRPVTGSSSRATKRATSLPFTAVPWTPCLPI